MRRFCYGLNLCLSFFILFLSSISFAADIRVGVISESVNKWPMWIAEDKNLFQAAGLNVELVLTGDATTQLNMLRNSELDISHQAADHIVRAIEKGDNFVVIHTITRAITDFLVAPGINSFEDLKGKVFALSNLNVSYWLMFDRILRSHNIKPGDFEIIDNIGGPVKRMQVLREGRAQATYMSPPASIEAEKDGYRRLINLTDYYPEFPASSIAGRRNWIESNRNIVVDYLSAYITATEWLRDENNREEAIDIAVRVGGHDRGTLPDSYEVFVKNGMVRFGTLSEAGYRQISELLLEAGIVNEISTMKKYADPVYQQDALRKYRTEIGK